MICRYFVDRFMNSIIKHLAIATKLLNQPVAEEALAANIARERNLNANIQSLSEVLRSYGFENHISRRKLIEIPFTCDACSHYSP